MMIMILIDISIYHHQHNTAQLDGLTQIQTVL